MRPYNCKYFNGIHNEQCRMGIAYASLGWKRYGSQQGLPCLTQDTREKQPCAHFLLPTREELDAHDTAVQQKVRAWMHEAQERELRGECFQCGTPMTAKQQVGRCIYVEPCGCRLGQGQLTDSQGKRVRRIEYPVRETVAREAGR